MSEVEAVTKRCGRCKEYKPLDAFTKSKTSSYCRPCRNEYARQYSKTERSREYQREYYKEKTLQLSTDPERLQKAREARDNGVCYKCGKPSVSITCDACRIAKMNAVGRERMSAIRAEYRLQGLCIQCGNLPAANAIECYDCIRAKTDRYLKKHYDISLADYNALYEVQHGQCAICKEHKEKAYQPGEQERGNKLVVDHCHNSGDVRQLLCNRCNTFIGLAREDECILMDAIAYIKRHKS